MDWNDPQRAYWNGRMGGMRPDAHAPVDAHISYGTGYQQFITEREEAERTARARWSSAGYSAGGSSVGGYGGSGSGGDAMGELIVAILGGICQLIYNFFEWYCRARPIWQWITCTGLLSGWSFVGVMYLWPLRLQFSGDTLVWCAATMWIWLALGIVWVPLNGLRPTIGSALILMACLGSMLTWRIVFVRYLMPNLLASDFGIQETGEMVLWIWVGFGLLFYPIAKSMPLIASWIAPFAWALAIIPWGQFLVRVVRPWLVQNEFGTLALLAAVAWIWLGVVIVFPLVSKISRALNGLITLIAYGLLPYVLVTSIMHNFRGWLAYMQKTENVWAVGVAVIGCVLLCAAVATAVALGSASLSVRFARILGFACIWTIGPMSILAWIDVPWRFFSQWFTGIHEWVSIEAAEGIGSWLLWLYVLGCLIAAAYAFHKGWAESCASLEGWLDDIKATGTILLPRDLFRVSFEPAALKAPSLSARAAAR